MNATTPAEECLRPDPAVQANSRMSLKALNDSFGGFLLFFSA